MLQVTKRSGKTEPYDSQKLKVSLATSSDEAGQILNDSDINNIVMEMDKLVEGKTQVTSQQLYTMLIGILYTWSPVLADRYSGHKENAWKR